MLTHNIDIILMKIRERLVLAYVGVGEPEERMPGTTNA
jgi:hypothetical protein